MIAPTVNKRLWYWPTRAGALDNYDLANQPLAAFITNVNMDGTVNIAYLDRNGTPDRKITVQLWQRGTPRPLGNFCEYHPDDTPFATAADFVGTPTLEETSERVIEPRPTLSLKKSTESK